MAGDSQGLDLSVTVPASEWGMLKRRVAYLEAVLVQVMREGAAIKEWFSAAELAALRLPDMPTAKNAVTRLAREAGWMMREVECQGGARHVYHFSSLPRRAFQELLDRVLQHPPEGSELVGNEVDQVHQVTPRRRRSKAVSPPICATNAAPAWVLPLMRIIRAEGANVSQALDDLPALLPEGIAAPTREEAVEVLTRLGLLKVS